MVVLTRRRVLAFQCAKHFNVAGNDMVYVVVPPIWLHTRAYALPFGLVLLVRGQRPEVVGWRVDAETIQARRRRETTGIHDECKDAGSDA